MEGLCDLAIVNISQHLSPWDLCNSSRVCKKWREKFNINPVWEKHLLFEDRFYRIQERYKDMILCPPFSSTLEPLCYSRQCYIRDQCLRFNYQGGLFSMESFPLKHGGKLREIFDVLDKEGNYWVFLNTTVAVEVWSVTNKPFFKTSILKEIANPTDGLYIIEKRVALVCSDFIQVFSFNSPKYELNLLCCFYFGQGSISVESERLKPNIDLWQKNVKHGLIGKYLIGYTGSITKSALHEATYLHVWNLQSLEKLYSTKLISESDYERHFSHDEIANLDNTIQLELIPNHEPSNKAIMILHEKKLSSVILAFDVERNSILFLKRCNKSYISWAKIIEDRLFIYGFHSKNGWFCTLNDVNTGETNSKHLTRFGVDFNSVTLPGNHPGLYIKVLNSLLKIEVKNYKMNLTFAVEDLYERKSIPRANICGMFLYLKASENEQVEMWDIRRELRIKDLPRCEGHPLGFPCSSLRNIAFPPKVFCMNKDNNVVYVLSFW